MSHGKSFMDKLLRLPVDARRFLVYTFAWSWIVWSNFKKRVLSIKGITSWNLIFIFGFCYVPFDILVFY